MFTDGAGSPQVLLFYLFCWLISKNGMSMGFKHYRDNIEVSPHLVFMHCNHPLRETCGLSSKLYWTLVSGLSLVPPSQPSPGASSKEYLSRFREQETLGGTPFHKTDPAEKQELMSADFLKWSSLLQLCLRISTWHLCSQRGAFSHSTHCISVSDRVC